MENKKEFTGVWIPRHIIEDVNLKPVARLIYAEIACFDICTMSNETLSERAGCSEATVSRVIKQLKDSGYIKIIGFNGRIRKMKSLFDKPVLPTQNEEAAYAKTYRQPTQNDVKDNNIENSENTSLAKAKGETPVEYGNPEINEMFRYWSDTLGYEITSKKQANRNACKNLIAKHGTDGLSKLILGVSKAQDDRYAPRIADFCDLQSKLNQLLVWGKSKQSSANNKVAIVS